LAQISFQLSPLYPPRLLFFLFCCCPSCDVHGKRVPSASIFSCEWFYPLRCPFGPYRFITANRPSTPKYGQPFSLGFFLGQKCLPLVKRDPTERDGPKPLVRCPVFFTFLFLRSSVPIALVYGGAHPWPLIAILPALFSPLLFF